MEQCEGVEDTAAVGVAEAQRNVPEVRSVGEDFPVALADILDTCYRLRLRDLNKRKGTHDDQTLSSGAD